jgi:hypothetical protein
LPLTVVVVSVDRTGRRVRNLVIEFISEGVILRGLTSTYYIKQLAQEEICCFLPNIRLVIGA